MTVPRQLEEVFVIRPPGLNKEQIWQQIWDRLEKENLARFPRPIYGRIPNFEGAEKAASRLAERPEFANLRPERVNGKERLASSIKGAFSLGEEVGLDKVPRPDDLKKRSSS